MTFDYLGSRAGFCIVIYADKKVAHRFRDWEYLAFKIQVQTLGGFWGISNYHSVGKESKPIDTRGPQSCLVLVA